VRARTKLKDDTDALAAPDVIAKPPTAGKTGQEIILPGNVYAYSDASLYARTDGYLSKWYFDIGVHVRQGQLLAIISSPEVDKQLLQARADLTTAEATAGLAKTNAGRYQGLLTQNAVSKQDTDTFTSQAESTTSAVKSAQANVQRLEELQSFEKIYAPFSGVITARNVDVGQLINAGAGTQLFRISAINVLRVYVNVPQIYSQVAIPGTTAELTLSEFPGQTFTGKLVRTAKAIDPSSRTLLVEIDVDNRDGKLMPGAYTEVHMNVHEGVAPLIIPVSALIFRTQGLQVGTVVKGPDGDEARLVAGDPRSG
jgi:RND family efflux transporter MFP subunit